MSLFLGAIHHWLYNKIMLQNKIVNKIITDFKLQDTDEYGIIEDKPLEEIIDASNIHMWLQEKINVVENKLAYVVNEVLNKDEKNLQKLKNIFFNKGKTLNFNSENAMTVFKSLDDFILDGMPCDKTKKFIEKTEDVVSWQMNFCVHKKYWDKFNLDICIYYILINSFIEGIIEDSNFVFTEENDIKTIKRK